MMTYYGKHRQCAYVTCEHRGLYVIVCTLGVECPNHYEHRGNELSYCADHAFSVYRATRGTQIVGMFS